MLTPDGTDGYEIATGSRSATVVAPTRNAGANLRTVFWSGAARPQRDALTCATWINATSDGVQQGSAVRIDAKAGGFVRAVTVTKNIYLNGFWIFNVHVWESATNEMRRIASVDLRETFASPVSAPPAVPVARALPWRLCTRVAGSTLEFKAWRLTELEPVWGDPAHGATVQLPPDAPTQGYAGWYVGHLEPGATTSFIDLVTGDGSPRSR